LCPQSAKCEVGGDYAYNQCVGGSCQLITGHCAPYRCNQATMMTCQTSCIAGDPAHNCLGAYYCSGGKCMAQKASGQSCTSNVECKSGKCLNGKCT
jgi:hypothetical protein